MKALKNLFLWGVLIVTLCGCKEEDIDGNLSFKPWICQAIISRNGNDCVANVGFDPDSKGAKHGKVWESTFEASSTDKHFRHCELRVNKDTMPNIITIGIWSLVRSGDTYESATFKLRCPTLFGDKAEHVLTCYWGEWEKRTKPEIDCYRLVLDGKTYEQDAEGLMHVTLDP